MEMLKKIQAKYLYFLACGIYCVLIFFSTIYLSPLEELGIPRMFADGEWYGIFGVRLVDGRFNILLGLDVFLLQKLHNLFPLTNTEIGVRLFYIFIAFNFAITAFVAHKLISETLPKKSRNFAYLLLIFLFYSPIFVYTNFRLLYTERYLFLVFLLIILAAVQFEKKKSNRLIFFIVLLANLGIHLKEVSFLSFICLMAFYLYRFIINRKETSLAPYLPSINGLI